MKKTILFFYLTILCLIPVFSTEAESFFDREGIQHTLRLGLGVNSGQGFEPYKTMIQPEFTIESEKLSFFGGSQIANKMLNFTVQGVWWPWHSQKVRFGAGGLFNYNLFFETSQTNNIMPGLFLEVRPATFFGLKMDVDCLFKFRDIFAIDEYKKWLYSWCGGLNLELDLYLPGEFMVYSKISSYEMYRYMMFMAPSFTFGISETKTKPFSFTLEASVRYTDFFTSSNYYDSTEIRLMMGFPL